MAIQEYLKAVGTKNYQGSTGYWGDRGDREMPWQYREGMGYPGDRAKTGIAAMTGVQAPAGMNTRAFTGQLPAGSRYSTETKPQNASDLFENAVVERNPEINAGINGLLAQWKANGDMTRGGFSDLFKAAQNEIFPQMKNDMATGNRYNLDWLANRLDSGNQQLRTFGEDLSNQYDQLNQDTRSAQQKFMDERRGELDRYQNFIDKDIRNMVGGDVTNMFGRMKGAQSAASGFNQGAGSSSTDAPMANDWYLRRLMPYYQQLHGEKLNTIGADIAQQREWANADVNRYGFDWGVQGTLRGNEANTAQALFSLAQQVKQMAPQQAVAYMQAMAIPAEIQQRILQGDISTLGQIGQLLPYGRYEGLSYKPGVNYAQPFYPNQNIPYNLPTPNYGDQNLNAPIPGVPANRYATPGEITGNGVRPGLAPNGGVQYKPLTLQGVNEGTANWNAAHGGTIGPNGQRFGTRYDPSLGWQSVPVTTPVSRYSGEQSTSANAGSGYTVGPEGVKLMGRYAGIYDGTLSPEDLPADIRGLVAAYGLDAN